MQKLKRLWLALVCFLIALSLCTFEMIYTINGADELTQIVNRAREEWNGGSGNTEEAVRLLSLAKEKWSEKESTMNVFLYHDKIDEIGVKLDCSKSLVELNSDNADAEMLEALAMLATIKRVEIPTLENIL